MTQSPAQRFYAIALSAVLTLATLGGIDQLATHPQGSAAQMAQQAAPSHA